jgi:hypothetical protein
VSDKETGLVEGWRYSVTTEKEPKSRGVFKGYTMLGSESAIVLQLSGGMIRMIPIVRIMHIDLIGPGERKRTEEKKPESGYYG